MSDSTLEHHIRDARASGKAEAEIRQGLLDQGWPEHLIDAALSGQAPSVEAPALGGALKPFGALFKESWGSYGYLMGIFWPLIVLFFAASLSGPLMKLGGIEEIPAVGIGLALLTFALALLLPIAEILALGRQDGGERPGLGGLLRAALRKFFGFLWVNVLRGFVTLGGAAALIVPGVILSVQTLFVPYMYVLENRRGLKAIESSRNMVRGLGWPVFWRILGFGLFGLGVFLVAGLIAGIVSIPAILEGIKTPVASGQLPLTPGQELLVAAITNLPNALLFPLLAAFPFWLYRDLRRLRGVAAVEAVRTDTKVFLGLGIVAAAVIVVFFVVAVAWFIASVTGTNPADWVSRLRAIRN